MSDKYPLHNFNQAKKHIIQFLFGVYMSPRHDSKAFHVFHNEIKDKELEALLGGPLSCPKYRASMEESQKMNLVCSSSKQHQEQEEQHQSQETTEITKSERRGRKRDLPDEREGRILD